jgi:hypothetical protein
MTSVINNDNADVIDITAEYKLLRQDSQMAYIHLLNSKFVLKDREISHDILNC